MKKNHKLNEHVGNEPVAILGMDCRFPGGSNSPGELWDNLINHVSAVSEVPGGRWDKHAYQAYHYGGFVDHIDLFDASFFRIGAAEANAMDPQQRILLEVTWHALEDAGINPDMLREEKVGIFIGQFSHDYQELHRKMVATPEELSVHYATGTCHAVSAGRIAYFLGTTGPALTIDTACSSSLVAVHQAVLALRHGVCEFAIVGGVNIILSPELQVNFSKAGMLSPNGELRAFDNQANGFVRGEGCGVVILRLKKNAIKENNRIRALIRGIAVNQDGASNGLTAPNGLAQEEVIKMALIDANIDSLSIDYVEAHGTGTVLGDPIELHALQQVYARERNLNLPLYVGSVKPNIGHLEAAAGMAGLIKIVLSLEHQKIPKQRNFDQINRNISLMPGVRIVQENISWCKSLKKTRLAGQSSFGFSGTNAHVILEEWCTDTEEKPDNINQNQSYLLVLSARDKEALHSLANDYIGYLENLILFELEHQATTISMEDIVCTAAVGRKHFQERFAIIASNKKDLLGKIKSLTDNHEMRDKLCELGVFSRPQDMLIKFNMTYVFSTLSTNDIMQLLDFYKNCEWYASFVNACLESCHYDELNFSSFLEQDAEQKMLENPYYYKIASFVFSYALAKYWLSLGIKSDGFIGFGIGKLVAAVMAKVITLEEAMLLLKNGIYDENKLTEVVGGNFTDIIQNINLKTSKPPIALSFRKNKINFLAENDWVDRIFEDCLYPESKYNLKSKNILFFIESPNKLRQEALLEVNELNIDSKIYALKPELTCWENGLHCIAMLYTNGADVNWQIFTSLYNWQLISIPNYPFQRKRYWLSG